MRLIFWPSLRPFATTDGTQGTNGPLLYGQGHSRAVASSAVYGARGTGGQRSGDRNPARDGVTPTPVISRAILVYNRERKQNLLTGLWLPLRTIHRRMAASSTIRLTAAQRMRAPLAGSKIELTDCSEVETLRSSA
jgi:hypothetical protein